MIKQTVLTFLFVVFSCIISAQSVIGKWKTIDDETGNERSIVEIYDVNGKIHAKIIQLLEKGKENKLCTQCKGDKKNKPIKGMVIINGLEKDGDEWNNGRILDPNTGKTYKCYITFDNNNTLKVRGYIGFAMIGRTQYWHRLTD